MKREKNGFVFMETVIVVGILSITLLLLYTSYEFILRKSQERTYFNTTESVYKIYYAKQIMDSLEPEDSTYANSVEWYVHNNPECSPVKEGAASYVCDISDATYKGNLLQISVAYNVEKIYFITYEELNARDKAWLNSFDATTIDYLKSLGERKRNIMVLKLNKYFKDSDARSEILHSSIDL